MVSRTAGQVPLLLVEVSTKRLQQFTKNEPPYAALSLAAWNSDEDTDTKARFDDLTFVATASFDLACSLAETHHYDWLWVDSVQYARARANDKGQNETINSLIHWYRRAETCFVHLPDLPPRCSATDKTAWGGCSWFRPLFALPALIASKTLTFYDREGNPRGDKSCLELLSTISNVTKIPQDVLRNAEQLPQMCAFRKCALVASRVTTDAQDYLYVLASLFDIRQPHHTEDDDPFHQLQAEIVRVRAGDLSLLAWESHYLSSAFHGVFADSVSTFVSLPSKIVLATYRFDSIQTCEPSWGQNWRVSAKCYDTDGGDFFMELGMTETGDRMGIRLRDLGGVCFRRHPYRLVNISQDMKGTMRVVELKTIGTPREGDLHSTELAQTVHTKRRYKESPTPEEQCFRIPVVAKSPAASRTDCTTARGSKRTKHHSVLAGDGLHMTQVELGMQTPRTNQGHDSDDDDDFSAAASSQEVLALEDGHPFLDAMDDILKAAIDEVSVELKTRSRTPSYSNSAFSCPLYSVDKRTYRSCIRQGGFATFGALKNHLVTAHQLPLYCPICLKTFEHSSYRHRHIREGACKPAPKGARIMGVSNDHIRDINSLYRRKNGSSADHWNEIFRILFPGERPPVSPFLGGTRLENKILAVRQFWSRRGEELVSTSLEGRGLFKYDVVSDEERSLAAVHRIILERLVDHVMGNEG